MKTLKFLSFSLIFLFSCSTKKDSESKPIVFEISKATYNGNPMLGTLNSFKNILAEPFSKQDTCSRSLIAPTQGYWIYGCIIPKNHKNATYSTYQNMVFLSKLNFSSSSEKIITPNLTLSNQTTLDEIITLFPDSYPQIYKDNPHLDKKSLQPVYINDDLPFDKRLSSNQLELQFKNDRLLSLTYRWKPEMTVAQISNARELERQVKEREN